VNAGHRSLLAAYPARIRRRHGAELITTMADLAGPAGRPTRADRRQLVLDGLRERFRLPAGRPFALVAAVLAVLIGGALGAYAGTWAGAFTYAELPDAGRLASVVAEPGSTAVNRSGGGTYLSVVDTLAAGTVPAAAAERARQRLIAQGWVTGPLALPNPHFRAESGGVELSVYVYPDPEPMLQIAGWPTRTAGYLALTLGGLLLGLLAGWLAAASAAHRIGAARRRRSSGVLAYGGLVLLVPPAVLFVWSLGSYLSATDPVGYGGLLPTSRWTVGFGPSRDLIHALRWQGSVAQPSTYQILTLVGLLLIVVAVVRARAGSDRAGLVLAGD